MIILMNKNKNNYFLMKIKTSGFTVGMTPWCIWFKGEVESKLIQFWFNIDSALKYQPWVSVEISMLIQCLNINVDLMFVNQRLFKFQRISSNKASNLPKRDVRFILLK